LMSVVDHIIRRVEGLEYHGSRLPN
jgi:hypothetical protein